ncbi:MAG: Tfp pilus assembly protein FimT/FimU, partial [Burkholderiaceae bacterium]
MLAAASYQRVYGLTLIELQIVLTLGAVVIALGAPAMGQWVREIEVRSSAALLLSALHATRAEALTRNASVRLDLLDTEGRPSWRMTCVQATVRCPDTLRQHAVDTGTAVRWGAAKLSTMPSSAT